MADKEYEQQRRECWIECAFGDCNLGDASTPVTVIDTCKQVFNLAFDRAYALGKQEKDAERSKEQRKCLRDNSKVCNKCHECDIDTDAWHSMYSR